MSDLSIHDAVPIRILLMHAGGVSARYRPAYLPQFLPLPSHGRTSDIRRMGSFADYAFEGEF